jgi:hypothetical protein
MSGFDITEPDAVDFCRQAFENLLAAAVFGDQARQLVESAMADSSACGAPHPNTDDVGR